MTQPGPPDPGHEPRPYFPSAGQGPVPGPPPASGGSYWLGLALGFLCWGVPPIALLFGLGDVTVAGVLGTVTMVLAVVGLIAASEIGFKLLKIAFDLRFEDLYRVTIKSRIGEQLRCALEVHDCEEALPVFLINSRSAPNDLLKLSHRLNPLVEYN